MRKLLIKWLGGYTSEEMKQSNYNSAQTGRYDALLSLRSYMCDINGADAETWCDWVWKYVCAQMEQLKKIE